MCCGLAERAAGTGAPVHQFTVATPASSSPATMSAWSTVRPAADTLRLTAARGVQFPSLLEFGALAVCRPGLVYTGSPDDATRPVVTNYELDWDRRLPIARLPSARFAVFYQTSEHPADGDLGHPVPAAERHVAQLPPATSAIPRNSASKLSAKGTIPGGWHWSIGYSPRLVQDHFLPDQADVSDRRRFCPHDAAARRSTCRRLVGRQMGDRRGGTLPIDL